jgi:antitoxin ParD1/3/4
MRTNIDIDDELMAAALAAGPYRTKREAVEAGLKLLQQQAAARKLLELEGKVDWGWGDDEAVDTAPRSLRSASPAPAKRAAATPGAAKAATKGAARKVAA